MKTYTLDQLINLDSGGIDIVQKNNDTDAQNFLEEKKEELSFLSPREYEQLKEYYTDTMEKYRLIYEAIVSGFSTSNNPGFPEYIYNINLKDGSIERDKNGRLISYSTEILAPCSTSMLHYINHECNDVFVIIPPIKSEQRTAEKMISECLREYDAEKENNLNKFTTDPTFNPEDEPELPFPTTNDKKQTSSCQTALQLNDLFDEEKTSDALINIAKKDIIPHDIYRLSITSKYPNDLEELIKELEAKFPPYISFEKGERNLYKKNLSENTRNYFDIKKTARITIPETGKTFFIEFQFKQTLMFFAHLRSHAAYEEYRILEAKYQALKDAEQKNKNKNVTTRQKLQQLKKLRDEKKELCLQIHRNAVHQSNLYLMHKIQWLDDNARGLHRVPDYTDDKYKHSVDTIKKNYIVESYEPFDGATAFTTTPDEYLNKSFYLKMIGILPESFDELGKNAKDHVMKAWNTLTPADLKDFTRISKTAVKYQDVIKDIQKKRKMMDSVTLLNTFAQNER